MERQIHGFQYQKMVVLRESLSEDENYTGKWDAFNKTLNLPCSVKCISQTGSIDFGDFTRQTQIQSDFILYVGFWRGSKTNIVEEYKVLINKETWLTYFGHTEIIKEMLEEMKSISNSREDDPKWKAFRLKWKDRYGDSIVSLRFKRDHKKQKRIQCGITKKNFLEVVLPGNQLI